MFRRFSLLHSFPALSLVSPCSLSLRRSLSRLFPWSHHYHLFATQFRHCLSPGRLCTPDVDDANNTDLGSFVTHLLFCLLFWFKNGFSFGSFLGTTNIAGAIALSMNEKWHARRNFGFVALWHCIYNNRTFRFAIFLLALHPIIMPV